MTMGIFCKFILIFDIFIFLWASMASNWTEHFKREGEREREREKKKEELPKIENINIFTLNSMSMPEYSCIC